MRTLLTFLLLLIPWSAYGQINLPAKAEWGEPIVARLERGIPEGATFEGQGWIFPDGLGTFKFDENTVGIWPAKAGTYTVKYTGFWILTKDVTFKDGDGNTITIKSYLGHGLYDESATIVVANGGPSPDPPGPDPPGPEQKWQLMMFYDQDKLDDLPQAQRNLLTSLTFRKELVSRGHVLLEILESAVFAKPQSEVPEHYRKLVDFARNQPLPFVVMAPKEGGATYGQRLPSTAEGFWSLLKDPTVIQHVKKKTNQLREVRR